MKMRKQIWACLMIVLVCVLSTQIEAFAVSHGRDLEHIAKSAVKSFTTIAQAVSVLGVLLGGVFMQVPGLDQLGRRTLAGGLVGCACAFGATAMESLLRSIFVFSG